MLPTLIAVGSIAVGLIILSFLVNDVGRQSLLPPLNVSEPEPEDEQKEAQPEQKVNTQPLLAALNISEPEDELTQAERDLKRFAEFLNGLTGSNYTFSDQHLIHLFNRVLCNPEYIEHPEPQYETQKLFYSIEECLSSVERYREELRERE